MIYFSQIANSKIYDDREQFIGKVKELIVDNREGLFPEIKGVIFLEEKQEKFISYECIESLGIGEVTLKKTNCWNLFHEEQSDILLSRDLMDRQIFDIDSIRVIRVNDLQLMKINDIFCLVAVDISFNALLRRLGLPLFPGSKVLKSQLIDWQSIDFVKEDDSGLKLKITYEKLQRLHPADIANLIENLSLPDGSKIIRSLNADTAADVLAEIEPKYKDILLENLNTEDLTSMVEKMSTDEATDVIQDLSHHKKGRVIEQLNETRASIIAKLAAYDKDEAGSLMTTDYLFIHEGITVDEAIGEIRERSEQFENIYHIFVVDNEHLLKGIVSIRTLLFSDKKSKIDDIMSSVIAAVSPHTSYENLAKLLTKYNLLSIAIVNEEKKLMGVVTVDDIMRTLIPNA
jgi:magnesium transporter